MVGYVTFGYGWIRLDGFWIRLDTVGYVFFGYVAFFGYGRFWILPLDVRFASKMPYFWIRLDTPAGSDDQNR